MLDKWNWATSRHRISCDSKGNCCRKLQFVMLGISLMKQQFVVTHWYTILQDKENTWQILNKQTCEHAMFLWKHKLKIFFLTEGVSLTQLSSKVGILVWRIVWVMTNCHFMSDMEMFYQQLKCMNGKRGFQKQERKDLIIQYK